MRMRTHASKPISVLVVADPEHDCTHLIQQLKHLARLDLTVTSQEDFRAHVKLGADVVLVVSQKCTRNLSSSTMPFVILDARALQSLGLVDEVPEPAGVGIAQICAWPMVEDQMPLTVQEQKIVQEQITENRAPIGSAIVPQTATVFGLVELDAGKHPFWFALESGATVGALRVAVLVGAANISELTATGYRIITDSLCWAHWVQTQGATTPTQFASVQDEKISEQLALSHTLDIEDYKTWVHEQVADKLYRRIRVIASFFGVAGLIAIFSIGWGYLNVIDDARKEELKKDVQAVMAKDINHAVAEKLLNLSSVREDVTEAAAEVIKQEINSDTIQEIASKSVTKIAEQKMKPENISKLLDEYFYSEEFEEDIAKHAIDAFRSKGGVESIINNNVGPVANSPYEPTKTRARALQLLIFFEDKDKLMPTLKSILENLDAAEDSDLYEIALTEFSPLESSNENADTLRQVVTTMRTLENLPPDVERAIPIFVSKFDSQYARIVLDAATDTKTTPQMADLLIQAVASMEGDETIEGLIALARNEDKMSSNLGWVGLSKLSFEPSSNEARIRFIQSLWPAVAFDMVDSDTDLTKHIYRREGPRPTVLALRIHLFRLHDENKLTTSGFVSLLSSLDIFRLFDKDQLMQFGRSFSLMPSLPFRRDFERISARELDELSERLMILKSDHEIEENAHRELDAIFAGSTPVPFPPFNVSSDANSHELKILKEIAWRAEWRHPNSNPNPSYLDLLSKPHLLSIARNFLRSQPNVFSFVLSHYLNDLLDESDIITYSTLRNSLDSSTVESFLLEAISRRLLELEQELEQVSAEDTARLGANATLRSFAFVKLLPPATDYQAWEALLASRKGFGENLDEPREYDRFLTALLHRASMSDISTETKKSYKLLVDYTLNEYDWDQRNYLVNVLRKALLLVELDATVGYAEQLMGAVEKDKTVAVLTVILYRIFVSEKDPVFQRQILTHAADLNSTNLVSGRIFLEALAQALDDAKESRISIIDFVMAGLDTLKDVDNQVPILLLELVLNSELDDTAIVELEDSNIARILDVKLREDHSDRIASVYETLYQKIKTKLDWVDGIPDTIEITETDHMQSWSSVFGKSSEVWIKVDNTLDEEFWIHVETGQLEVTEISHDQKSVLGRFTLSMNEADELASKETSFVRLRDNYHLEDGEEVKFRLESRTRLPDLSSHICEQKDFLLVSTNSSFRADSTISENVVCFQARRGTSYVIKTQRLTKGVDTKLFLLRKNDDVIAFNDDYGQLFGSKIEWTAFKDEIVKVKIDSFRGTRGKFDLEITEVGKLDMVKPQLAVQSSSDALSLLPPSDFTVPVQFGKGVESGWIGYQLPPDQVFHVFTNSDVLVLDQDGQEVSTMQSALDAFDGVFDRATLIHSRSGGFYRVKLNRASSEDGVVFIWVQVADEELVVETVAATAGKSIGDVKLVDFKLLSSESGLVVGAGAASSSIKINVPDGKYYEFIARSLSQNAPGKIEVVGTASDKEKQKSAIVNGTLSTLNSTLNGGEQYIVIMSGRADEKYFLKALEVLH